MRKALFIILLLTSVFSSPGQGSLRPRGDVNCDWEVSIADVNMLVDDILSETPYHSFYTYAHDLNGDQEITIADLNMVIGAIFGDELPPMPSYSGTLPVLFINTEGYQDITSKEEYLHADWWLDNMGIDSVESIGSAQEPQGMLIKGRGNYTWTLNKKPFRIKLDTKQKLLGMKKDRHFCLLAHASWNDFLTNTVGFELSRRIGLSYTPSQEPVEVVLNGQYIGLYYLAEKIRVDKNRVDVEEQVNGSTSATHVTGGWLLEIDDHPDDCQFGLFEGNGNWLAVKYHYPDSLSDTQLYYIYDFIRDTDNAIYSEDFDNCPWEQYIDMDTLACFYIVNEVTDEIESFANSLFIHKRRGENSKLLFGPVWDFGCSFGRAQNPATDFLYENTESNYKAHWLMEIVKYPQFQACVRKHWSEFYPAQLETIEQFIDDYVDKISNAGNADAVRWPENFHGVSLKKRSEKNYKPYLRAKIEFLKEQWGDQGEEQIANSEE